MFKRLLTDKMIVIIRAKNLTWSLLQTIEAEIQTIIWCHDVGYVGSSSVSRGQVVDAQSFRVAGQTLCAWVVECLRNFVQSTLKSN